MGDYYQTIVDVEVTEEDSPQLAERIVAWLHDEGVIDRQRTNQRYTTGTNYLFGPRATEVVQDAAYFLGDYAGSVARNDVSPNDPLVFNVWVNVITHRSLVWNTAVSLECLACGAKTGDWDGRCVMKEVFDTWVHSAADWGDGGEGLFSCPDCGHVLPVTEWKQGDCQWGFGNLAFWFWNYGLLKDEFVEEFGRRLGHRIVVPRGKF
jgi:hypothetical protein